MRWYAPIAIAALASAAPRVADAHIQLTYPPARTRDQKEGPCGAAGSVRSTSVTALQPGQKITVEWDETVEHPGHFRISFDDEGDDDFATPASYDAACSNGKVLVDLIPDRKTTDADQHYRQEITLPNFECENCTLQLIQVMVDKPPYSADPSSNDIYYQCADVALRGRPSSAAPAPACQIASGAGGAGGACGAGGAGGAGGEPGGAGGEPGGAGGASGAGGVGGSTAGGAAAAGEGDGCAFGQVRGGGAAWFAAAAFAVLVSRRRARTAR
jgi:Lytic polysaccharide mono-oxygenase, cellulose-degrading